MFNGERQRISSASTTISDRYNPTNRQNVN